MEFFKIRRDIPFMRHALVVQHHLARHVPARGVLPRDQGPALLDRVHRRHGDGGELRARRPRSTGSAARSTRRGYTDLGAELRLLARRADPHAAQAGPDRAPTSRKAGHGRSSTADDATAELRRVEFVGPQVGRELAENGALALLITSLGIVVYLALRFEWKFGVAAIIANLHDVVIILGLLRASSSGSSRCRCWRRCSRCSATR